MTYELGLDTLPSDVLLIIFEYCHAFDLVRLSEVCRRFNVIVRSDRPWRHKRNLPLATNQNSERFRERCHNLLDVRTRWHVSENWQRGKYERRVLHSWKVKAMPCIRLTADVLWWSDGNYLTGLRRQNRRNSDSHRALADSETVFDRGPMNNDVIKFVVRDKYVIGSHNNGSITFFDRRSSENDYSDIRIENAHAGKVTTVDEVPRAVISGSADGTVKLWSNSEGTEGTPLETIDIMDRVWSVAGDITGTTIAVGSSGNTEITPLKLYDIECCTELISLRYPRRRGAGILDIVWEDSNVLLTCGYDTTVRKWDARVGSCIAAWVDPTDAALYCLSSDYHFTIVSGCQYNSKAVLWDQRMRKHVQLYFMKTNSGRTSSPVYSIDFDSSHLYGATDRCLMELTFSGYGYYQCDYRFTFRSPQMP